RSCRGWTLQHRHALYVRRLREHVHRTYTTQLVTGVHELGRVGRERGGVARHVDDPPRARFDDATDDLLGQARPGRVDDEDVRAPPLRDQLRQRQPDVAGVEVRVVDIVE